MELHCFTRSLCLQQGSASESTLMALLAARCKAVRRVHSTNGEKSEAEIFAKLVAYTSEQVSTKIYFNPTYVLFNALLCT